MDETKKPLPPEAAYLTGLRIDTGASLHEARCIATYKTQTGEFREVQISLDEAQILLAAIVQAKNAFPVKVH